MITLFQMLDVLLFLLFPRPKHHWVADYNYKPEEGQKKNHPSQNS